MIFMKNILISNDDGVLAPGIFAAKQALENFSNTTVVAPQENNSGVGRSLSVFKQLNIEEYSLKDGSLAYGVSGTPADSVDVGINYVLDEKPDLVVTGINSGVNLSNDIVTTSGTICAAIEAVSNGIPAIAVSLFIDQESYVQDEDGNWEINYDFSSAQEVLMNLVKKVLKKGFPDGINLLNLNIPANLSSSEIKVTKFADRMLDHAVIDAKDEIGNDCIMIAPNLIEKYDEGTDGYCLMVEKRPSLTPLKIDFNGDLNSLREWL